MQIYMSACSEGKAVTLFLHVFVVGCDRSGKTRLTKALALREFDPKCQVVVKESCDWSTPLTRDVYDKNVAAIMAEELNTPEVKDQYFRSKEEERLKRSKEGQKSSHVLRVATLLVMGWGKYVVSSPAGHHAHIARTTPTSDSRPQLHLFSYELMI